MLLNKDVWKDNLYLKLIGEELLRRAEADAEFKTKLEEADCTLSDVFSYITDEVSKMPQVNRCVAVDDATVYGMADKCIREGIWKQRKEAKEKAQKKAAESSKSEVKKEKINKKEKEDAISSVETAEIDSNEELDEDFEEEVEVEEKPVKKEKKEVKAKPKKESLEDVFGGLFD